jgi:HlyD family secretion protein
MDRPLTPDNSGSTRYFRSPLLVALLVATGALAGLALLLAYWQVGGANDQAGWLTVEGGRLQILARGSGRLVSASQFSVAAGDDGQVREIHARVGDAVEAGHVVIELESQSLRLALEEAELAMLDAEARAEGRLSRAESELAARRLALDRAQLEADIARLEFESSQALVDSGVISRLQMGQADVRFRAKALEVDSALAAVAAAEVELARERRVAEAERTLARIRHRQLLERNEGLRLRAPIAGRILSLPHTRGVFVRAGEVLFAIGPDRPDRVQASFSQRYAGLIEPGTRVEVEILGTRVGGRVSRMAAELVQGQIQAEIDLDAMPADARLDMSVRVQAEIATLDEAVFAASPLELPRDGARVTLAVEGQPGARRVDQVRSIDGYLVFRGGVRPGERIRILEVER